MGGDNVKSPEEFMKTLKTIIAKYLCNLLMCIAGFIIPEISEITSEKYFHMTQKEIREELYGHAIAIVLDIAFSVIATLCPTLTMLVSLPIAIFMIASVMYLVVSLINIAQRVWMDLHPTMSEYVDPETGVTRTLMTYEKKRFI